MHRIYANFYRHGKGILYITVSYHTTTPPLPSSRPVNDDQPRNRSRRLALSLPPFLRPLLSVPTHLRPTSPTCRNIYIIALHWSGVEARGKGGAGAKAAQGLTRPTTRSHSTLGKKWKLRVRRRGGGCVAGRDLWGSWKRALEESESKSVCCIRWMKRGAPRHLDHAPPSMAGPPMTSGKRGSTSLRMQAGWQPVAFPPSNPG